MSQGGRAKASAADQALTSLWGDNGRTTYTSICCRTVRKERAGPLAETVKDTLAWRATVPEERRAKPRFIISPEIEAKALLDWKARG